MERVVDRCNEGEKMRQRDRSLDFIKVIATILIVLHHYQQVIGETFKNIYNVTVGMGRMGSRKSNDKQSDVVHKCIVTLLYCILHNNKNQ